MSTRGVTGTPLRGYVRNSRRRKTVLEVDLSVPPSENRDQVGTSARANSRDEAPDQLGRSVPPAPIDVEAFDDDVVISSPRAFTEVRFFLCRKIPFITSLITFAIVLVLHSLLTLY